MKKEIGIIGLGKMGKGIALSLLEKGWRVVGYNHSPEVTKELAAKGLVEAYSPSDLISKLSSPKLVWLMIPAKGKNKNSTLPVDEVLFSDKDALVKLLAKGDTVIDGGNSYFKEAARREKKLASRGILFIDVGFSGGPGGARNGGCLMIGGNETAFTRYEPLFKDLSLKDGYKFFKGAGAGHFVKMVHNGIEYGMMQAIAEGFAILKQSKYKLDLIRATDIYNHGSVIESRLIGWMKSAYEAYGENLGEVSGVVGHTGEGEWTAKTAREMKIPAKVIEESYKFRVRSAKKPSYTGKIVAALRNQFGGHSIKK